MACICRGNWRLIVKEAQPFIGKQFNNVDGVPHTFFGVVWAEDDFYYGMWNRLEKSLALLSCVGSIESHGYTPVLTTARGMLASDEEIQAAQALSLRGRITSSTEAAAVAHHGTGENSHHSEPVPNGLEIQPASTYSDGDAFNRTLCASPPSSAAEPDLLARRGVLSGVIPDAAEQTKPDDPVFHRQSRLLHSIIPAEQAQAGESREARMVVVERDESGKPTVWCDPEIVDLVTALNAAGIRTVASCSGHGEQHGNIALADGRELLIAPSFEAARSMEADVRRLAGGVMVDDAMIDRAHAAIADYQQSHFHAPDFVAHRRELMRAALVAALSGGKNG